MQEALIPEHRVWWVGLDYPQSEVAWASVKWHASKIPMAQIQESQQRVLMPGGGWMQIKSSDSSLLGEGLDFVILDEAAHYMNLQDVWRRRIRPSITDRRGKALIISTPNGPGVFSEMEVWALKNPDEWEVFHFTTADNPHIDKAEIAKAKAELPDPIFRQEYLGEYVESAAAAVISVAWLRAASTILRIGIGERRIISCDVATEADGGDETVVYKMVNTDIVAAEYFRHQNTMETAGKLHIMAKEHGAIAGGLPVRVPVIVDAIGVGDGVKSRLQELGTEAIPFIASEAPKNEEGLYANLRAEAWASLAKEFRNGRVRLTWEDQELWRQLTAVRYKYASGKIAIEAKKDTSSRLGRSPDRADAYMMGVWGLRYCQPVREQRKPKEEADWWTGKSGYKPRSAMAS